MPFITGIVTAEDHPGRVVIMVDGEPFATVDAGTVATLGLATGAPAEAVEPLRPLDAATQKTYERAINVLGYRERSARDLRKRLLAKGEPAAQIDAALARMQAHGLLDDGRFAAQRARVAVVAQARSPRRVRHDLAQRGVSREVADAAVASALADEGTTEQAVALRAARKKLATLARLPLPERRQKLYAYLARQGYAPDAVRRAVQAALADPATTDDAT